MLEVVINHTLLLWFIRRQQRSFRWAKSSRLSLYTGNGRVRWQRNYPLNHRKHHEEFKRPPVYSVMESQDKFAFWFSLSCLGSCLELSCLVLAQSHRQTNKPRQISLYITSAEVTGAIFRGRPLHLVPFERSEKLTENWQIRMFNNYLQWTVAIKALS